uniref:Uncharacterized protein n=1 Tax=Thermosporothrix sp. COM3 TaxID=2490863 RepID=A0A455SA94_9CHLR|nr:hypothetical protein KTC_01280 [Thermosporothrix sp. COM3]
MSSDIKPLQYSGITHVPSGERFYDQYEAPQANYEPTAPQQQQQ